MINRIFKKLDSSGRINIPKELLDLKNIKEGEKIALCTDEESGGIKIKSFADSYNEKIVGVAKLDSKGRFIIPKYLQEDTKKEEEEVIFEIFVHKSELIVLTED